MVGFPKSSHICLSHYEIYQCFLLVKLDCRIMYVISTLIVMCSNDSELIIIGDFRGNSLVVYVNTASMQRMYLIASMFTYVYNITIITAKLHSSNYRIRRICIYPVYLRVFFFLVYIETNSLNTELYGVNVDFSQSVLELVLL